jgi:catechol 2,3-dioxygenase-like lactoylglutathione lyase family enzyme
MRQRRSLSIVSTRDPEVILKVPKTEFTGIGIFVKVRDIYASRKFYESLGFEPIYGFGDEDFRATLPRGIGSSEERYRGVIYRLADGAELEITDGHVAVAKEVFAAPIATPKVSGMIRVKSIVPILDVALTAVRYPVRKYYWGSIEVVLRDPDGFVLVFVAPATDEEFAAVSELTAIEVIEPGQR